MIFLPGEMHVYYDEKNRERLYTEMLAFFDRHIGKPQVDAGSGSD